jgi:hypothetical protein
MGLHSQEIDALLSQDLTCQIIRVLLASGAPVGVDAIASRLAVNDEEIMGVLTELQSYGLVQALDNRYLVSAHGRATPQLWQTIEAYEARLIQERAKQFTLDIPTRFELTETLRAGIARARADAASRR